MRRKAPPMLSAALSSMILSGCVSPTTLSVPSIFPGSSNQQPTPQEANPLPDICRQTHKLGWYGGDYDPKTGLPLFSVDDLRKITARTDLTPDHMAGHLRSYVGDTTDTVMDVKEFNARRKALCGDPVTEQTDRKQD